MSALPTLPSETRRPRRKRGVPTILAWTLLVFSYLMFISGNIYRGYEFMWHDVTAEVQGHELVFSTPEGETCAVLHLSPLPGAAAWQEGDKVKLSYYEGKPQFAVLREQRPSCLSDKVEVWGFYLLMTGVPLAFLVARRVERKRAAEAPHEPAPAAIRRRSVVDWCAYAAVGLALGLAIVCAFGLVSILLYLPAFIHYDPDANGQLVALLGCCALWLLGAVLLALLSRALYRRDKRRYGLSRE